MHVCMFVYKTICVVLCRDPNCDTEVLNKNF